MNILLTGGNGFVGKNIIPLLSRNHNLYCITRKNKLLPYAKKTIIVKDINSKSAGFYEGLIEDNNIDVVVHMAAISREHTKVPFKEYLDFNVGFTKKLYKAVQGKEKTFVFISTAGVYGTIPSRCPADEKTIKNANGKYHKSKEIAEEELLELNETDNTRLVILRPIIMYGKGDKGFLYKIFSLHGKGLLPIFDKNIKWHLLDVNLFGKIVDFFIKNDVSGVFNVADDKPLNVLELKNLVSNFQNGKGINLPKKIFDVFEGLLPEEYKIKYDLVSKSWYYDVSKLKKTGISLGNTFENIKKYSQWYSNRSDFNEK